MSDGQVHLLDTMTEQFISHRGSYVLATIKKSSYIAYEVVRVKEQFKQGYCVSVSERGQGCLHLVKMRHKRQSLLSGQASNIEVTMELAFEFACSQKVSWFLALETGKRRVGLLRERGTCPNALHSGTAERSDPGAQSGHRRANQPPRGPGLACDGLI
jgi:hypothetical protein